VAATDNASGRVALVSRLQALLADIYDVPVEHDVAGFLVEEHAGPPSRGCAAADEQLLVCEEEGELALGLYLEPGLLRRLEAANPLDRLDGANLADYWSALEGVSHFVCVAWNARHDRCVSLLELELQAEVDKFVTSHWLLQAQDPARFPAELHRVLFDRARIDPDLAGARQGLYRRAHRYAARFCGHLACRLRSRGAGRVAGVVSELRRFYRLSDTMKQRYIEALAA
jgi:hypothetical protein